MKFRRTEAARLVRAAHDVGLMIKGITLAPDGTLALVISEPATAPGVPPSNPWEKDPDDAA